MGTSNKGDNSVKPKQPFSERWGWEKCANVFTTSPLLERHIKYKHCEEQTKETEHITQFRFSKPSYHDQCEEKFTTIDLLKEHKLKSHTNDEEMLDTSIILR